MRTVSAARVQVGILDGFAAAGSVSRMRLAFDKRKVGINYFSSVKISTGDTDL
jgi:hypothetical protein